MAKKDKKDKKEKRKRAKKDKDAPKKAISAYFFYIKDRRPVLKKEKPNLENKEIIREMGKEWKELSDEKKKPYVQKAEKDKVRYDCEKKEYDKKVKAKK